MGQSTLDFNPSAPGKDNPRKSYLDYFGPSLRISSVVPDFVNLLIAPPIVISTEHIVHPIDNQRPYPLRNPQWSLFACKISGHGMKQRVIRKSYQPSHIR